MKISIFQRPGYYITIARAVTLMHVREEEEGGGWRRRGSKEKLEGRRRGILTMGELYIKKIIL